MLVLPSSYIQGQHLFGLSLFVRYYAVPCLQMLNVMQSNFLISFCMQEAAQRLSAKPSLKYCPFALTGLSLCTCTSGSTSTWPKQLKHQKDRSFQVWEVAVGREGNQRILYMFLIGADFVSFQKAVMRQT